MRIATSYLKDTSGNLALIAALSSTVVVGAAGFGLDTYRLENTRTMLDQTVGLTCDRIENADYALYPSKEERMEMARVFSADLVKQSKLDPAHTTIDVTSDGDKIKVTGASTIDATMMKIFGHNKLASASNRDCTAPSKAPPTKACTPEDLIYLNPGNFEIAAGTLVAGQKNYTATLFDAAGNIKARQVVGNGSGVTEVFLKTSSPDDIIVVQPFNADGTTPAACNPVVTPPVKEVCTESKVAQMAVLQFPNDTPKWEPSPGVAEAFKNGSIGYTRFGRLQKFPLSPNFKPEVLFLHQSNRSDSGQGYLDTMSNQATVHLMPNNLAVHGSNYRNPNSALLYRIVGLNSAAWELQGQCVMAASPIVLDLIAKGEITTTGVSSARYLIPQHRVNATVDFDLSGTGKTVRTEWISGNGQALLVDNRDGKAATDMNGTRLFGDMGGHAHGYEKLAMLDANGDSKISHDELQGLAAWIDNGDARVQDGELKTLAEVGISEMSTVIDEVPTGDGGTHLRSTAILNGKTIMTEDVWFGVDITAKVSDAGAMQSLRVTK